MVWKSAPPWLQEETHSENQTQTAQDLEQNR